MSMTWCSCHWTCSSPPSNFCRSSQVRRQLTHDFFRPHFLHRCPFGNRGLRSAPPEGHSSRNVSPSRSNVQGNAASQTVLRLLETVEGTDRGADASEELQTEVQGLIETLEAIGQAQVPRPLDNPLIFGNYDVAYVSTRNAPKQDGQPAGGRFRSRLGRMLFRTVKVCQSVIQPDVVTNKVEFSMFGIWPGHIGLRGKLEDINGEKETVKVFFEKPELCVAGLCLRIGPESSVVLKTTYLDEAVRLGKGSRGSSFVFVRGGEADAAGMEEVGKSCTRWWGVSWVLGGLLGLCWVISGLLKVQHGSLRFLGPLAGLFFALSCAGAWNERRLATAH